MRRIALLLIVLSFSGNIISVASQPSTPGTLQGPTNPQKADSDAQQLPKQQQRGTDAAPIVNKLVKPGETNQKTDIDTDDKNKKSPTDWALIFTAMLVAFTSILALAAMLQASISSDTAKKQLRAYIGVDVSEDKRKRTPEHHGSQIHANVDAKNYGQTPALDVKMSSAILYSSEPLNVQGDFVFPEGTTEIAMNPSQSTNLICKTDPNQEYTAADWDTLRSPLATMWLYVIGKIIYTDVFNHPHHVQFCFKLVWREGPDKPPRWDWYERYNETDKDSPTLMTKLHTLIGG